MSSGKTITNMQVAFVAAIVTALLFLFLFFSIGVRTRKYTYADSKALARELSHQVANETNSYLSSALGTSQALVDKSLIYRKLGGNRADINKMLMNEVTRNKNVMAAWTMWEPNAFDNRDKDYRNDTLYDPQGSMSIAFFKSGDSYYYERNEAADFQQDFYSVPKRTGKDLILEPFHYQYHGYPIVFYQTSAVVPILVDSTFLGVFGVDINLDSLQYKLSKIRLYKSGFISLISGTGIIISHRDSSLIDKNFYNLLSKDERDKYSDLETDRELTLETVSEFSQEQVFRFFYPISVGDGAKPWHIMVEIPIKQATVRSQQLLLTGYVTLVLGLLLLTYMIVNIFDRRRYERHILLSMRAVEESKNIIAESEIRFRTIFENANDAILIMKDLICVDCNPITSSMFGCPKDQIIGKTPEDFSPRFQPNGNESVQYALHYVILAQDGIPQRFEWQHQRPDGSFFDADVSLNMLILPDAYLIQAVVRDITDKKRTERETLEKKERLQKFVDSMTDWIYSVKLVDGHIIGVDNSEGFTALTGFVRGEIPSSLDMAESLIHEDDLPILRSHMIATMKDSKVRPFEHRLKHKSGAVKWVRNYSIPRFNEEGKVVGFDGLVTDITERKMAEAALQESEKNFRNIFDKTNHGIIIVRMDGRILAANSAFSEISGYDFHPETPMFVTDFVVPEQLEKLKERIANRYSRKNLPPFEYKAKYKDGKVHIVEADGSMMDFNGQNAILVVLRDVTEIRETEQRVMEAVIQTEETERSRIAQDLHDGLGPVLSTIKLYFQVYKDSSDAAKKEFLIEKLKTTIDEAIKAVSEISRNLSPHVLRNYGFYAAMMQFIHQIEQANLIAFSVDFGDEPAMNSNTSIFLYRAISELINNSIKHSGCSNISLKIAMEKGTLILEYGDDGKGFDVESVRANHATGSGLQNIINRIQALNGKVTIKRNAVAGMTTMFIIPV